MVVITLCYAHALETYASSSLPLLHMPSRSLTLFLLAMTRLPETEKTPQTQKKISISLLWATMKLQPSIGCFAFAYECLSPVASFSSRRPSRFSSALLFPTRTNSLVSSPLLMNSTLNAAHHVCSVIPIILMVASSACFPLCN